MEEEKCPKSISGLHMHAYSVHSHVYIHMYVHRMKDKGKMLHEYLENSLRTATAFP